MKTTTEIAAARALEQANEARIIPRARDRGPLEVDPRRYKIEYYPHRCKWCGSRMRSAEAYYCARCGFTQRPCIACGGPVKRGRAGGGPGECTACRKLYQSDRRKPWNSRSSGRK